jgi:hypothetical protein
LDPVKLQVAFSTAQRVQLVVLTVTSGSIVLLCAELPSAVLSLEPPPQAARRTAAAHESADAEKRLNDVCVKVVPV